MLLLFFSSGFVVVVKCKLLETVPNDTDYLPATCALNGSSSFFPKWIIPLRLSRSDRARCLSQREVVVLWRKFLQTHVDTIDFAS